MDNNIVNNDEITLLYNEITHLIHNTKEAVYKTVNTELISLYWNIERTMFQIVQTLSAQLTWSHIKELISMEDSLKREFYATMCQTETWSVRTLKTSVPPKEVFEEKLHKAILKARLQLEQRGKDSDL